MYFKKLSLVVNKIWLDKGSESYNKSVKWWLKYNGIETYSKHSKEESVD